MPFPDIELRDNGSTTFDIALDDAPAAGPSAGQRTLTLTGAGA